jgi:signal transduction histidine kinase/ActR/RegA family two-component response regulator
MTAPARDSPRLRVLVLTPTGKDGVLTEGVLRKAGLDALICPSMDCIEQVLEEGAGLLLVAEEAIANGALGSLAEVLSRQEPWSDLPVLLLTRYGADSKTVVDAMHALSNVALLERPVRPATLVSAVKAGLKARQRQYQVRAQIVMQDQMNHALEASIAQRQKIEAALREADRRKDEFLATLAHELRNPLAPIRNSLHILRLSSGGNSAAEQVCEMMERQVGTLVRLVDDLMEVSRITRGKVELRLEPVELAGVIRSAVEASRPLIEAAGHQLAISLPTEPLLIHGDPVRLAQVFSNLLNNAARYMNEGGQIWLGARQESGQAIVSVRDTGIGIAAETLPVIFNMFTQVDRSTRRAQGGLGIGLTLVRTLVEMHGGQVEAHSPGLGLGSEFVVRLPLSGDPTGPGQKSENVRHAALPRCRVMVVDDNRDSAVSLGLLLKLLGVEVQVVHDGRSALEKLPLFHPTVVLLDIGMPGMDGYEVARRIRQQPQGQDVMLIALTGWGQEEDRRRSSQAGFNHHLTKPADIDALQSLFMSLEDVR